LKCILPEINSNSLFDKLICKFSQTETIRPELRTIFTSFITFAYEYDSIQRYFKLTDEKYGTGEPFFVHLIKGCIIFESLLKNSETGNSIPGKKTLNDYLKNEDIYTGLGLSSQPEGINARIYLFKQILS